MIKRLKITRVRFTDSTDNMVQFLREGGDQILFPESRRTLFRRVR